MNWPLLLRKFRGMFCSFVWEIGTTPFVPWLVTERCRTGLHSFEKFEDTLLESRYSVCAQRNLQYW
jgi:hypothetical protein